VEPLSELRLELDEDAPWFRRAKEFMHGAAEYWNGTVQVGMTDLGGTLDVLSSFRPGEHLLLDLYDDPAAVERKAWEIHEQWWKAFDKLDAVIRARNPGYSSWAHVFCEQSTYMLQCDFCYMIGPQMFDDFVKPELSASCERLAQAFYHLDGPGQLPHLDSLLEIEALRGVQWIHGAGNKPCKEWPEVYEKIHEAGKKIQLFEDPETLDRIADRLGTAESILFMCEDRFPDDGSRAEFLEKYGVPVEA
jgi:5-methyltetrahydrofolate--homocysteine methyltransferase